MTSLAYQVARNPELLKDLSPGALQKLQYNWEFWGRQGQLEPEAFEQGRALIWMLLAGRGYGKTRSGSELIRKRVNQSKAGHIALVAPTAADARDIMVLGGDATKPSGLISVSSPYDKAGIPVYHPSKRLLEWPRTGAQAMLYSAEDPDALRGPNHDLAWADELAAWRHTTLQSTWDNLQMTLRIGSAQCVVTTTPRPLKLLKDLIKRNDVYITRGSTYENLANLAEAFKANVISIYAGTRLGRQELDAQILEDTPGALFTLANIEANRLAPSEFNVDILKRIVVAIDPTGSGKGHEAGIVVGGISYENDGYLLEDASGTYTPKGWAERAIRAYHNWFADAIVVETNFGAEMVRQTIHSLDPNIKIIEMRASQGKRIRAEPVSGQYEQNHIHHVGTFGLLEEQMTEWLPENGPNDRFDANVWLWTELKPTSKRVHVWYKAGRGRRNMEAA